MKHKCPACRIAWCFCRLENTAGRPFDLLTLPPLTLPPTRRHCFVGHRFTGPIERKLLWNLRELFSIFGVDAEYVGFDGASVALLDELQRTIDRVDFCLFDNRETTRPSKPNVYIETGMALALGKPFIFCHYKREVWPSDFAGVLYVPYATYRDLFSTLYSKLPLFLKRIHGAPAMLPDRARRDRTSGRRREQRT